MKKIFCIINMKQLSRNFNSDAALLSYISIHCIIVSPLDATQRSFDAHISLSGSVFISLGFGLIYLALTQSVRSQQQNHKTNKSHPVGLFFGVCFYFFDTTCIIIDALPPPHPATTAASITNVSIPRRDWSPRLSERSTVGAVQAPPTNTLHGKVTFRRLQWLLSFTLRRV